MCRIWTSRSQKACRALIEMGVDILAPEMDTWVVLELQDHVRETRLACTGGDGAACRGVAKTAQSYDPAPLFRSFAQPLMQKACDLGDLTACMEITATPFTLNRNHPYEQACSAGLGKGCALAVKHDLSQPPKKRVLALSFMCFGGQGAACGIIGDLLQGRDFL